MPAYAPQRHRLPLIRSRSSSSVGSASPSRVQLVALAEPGGRGDLDSVVGDGQAQAGQVAPAVEQHRARAALAVVAALLDGGRAEPLAQRVEQGGAGVDVDGALGAVDGERDGRGHAGRSGPHLFQVPRVRWFTPSLSEVSQTPRPDAAVRLDLRPHPEGGWYRRTWAAPSVTLPDGRVRPGATLIWFHLSAGKTSAWHRGASDEVWLARTGTVALELGGSGARPGPGASYVVGPEHEGQVVVPAGTWQRTVPGAADALVSCVVSPGFDFADFELA
ncbi:hypothetical protein LUZ63_020009 [Rhynchospora breviuscula]|uniref:DUF985 domain-containing protein n=1 Tax=Rhynchospora breviuscula TaxID=2022672 RepID=A0A9Q0C117_9POAL|nr:hypothetical protein LUZ63_020009 [Rhynchospora breviuscula]